MDNDSVSYSDNGPHSDNGAYGEITLEGGNGSSLKNAVIIKGARNTLEGVGAEYGFVADLYGQEGIDWWRGRQEFFERENGGMYDVLDIKLKNGRWRKIYFNVTEFFGT